MNTMLMLIGLMTASANNSILSQVQHGFANNEDIRIHYAVMGDGSLVVMIHGFPDFWYSWRNQMKGLADKFRVAAVDLRGYNLSGKPPGVESYAMPRLASDISAVIHHKGLQRKLASNPEQQKNSQYARDFQEPNAHLQLTAEVLAGWVTDPDAKTSYIDALEKSDFEAMLNYYKANYPRPPYTESDEPVIKVKCPVLMFHGLEDWALLPGALNDTWKWIDNELTLVTIPGAGHFVQHDASERVTQVMRRWLLNW